MKSRLKIALLMLTVLNCIVFGWYLANSFIVPNYINEALAQALSLYWGISFFTSLLMVVFCYGDSIVKLARGKRVSVAFVVLGTFNILYFFLCSRALVGIQ